MSAYVGRFAPSPTGPLHFGSLVAAVGSFVDARSRGGKWSLRIDDLDTPRCVSGAAAEIARTLEAFGLEWDGPITAQNSRRGNYRAALDSLIRRDLAYPCSCTRREIADSGIRGVEGAVYPGRCRNRTPPGRSTVSFRMRTDGSEIVFDDRIQGRVSQVLERDVGDFVLKRADGLFAYQLASVVDDADMAVTHVVRGVDLLASTPRQIHLQRALGLRTPHYVHLPVAVNAAGEKLSKQTLAPAVRPDDAADGIARVLEFLGHAPPSRLPRGELLAWAVSAWDLSRVPRRLAIPAGTMKP